jgi:putative transposase
MVIGSGQACPMSGGRPRKTDMREAMNAIYYLLRTGCPWRYLPRDRFPARSTVCNLFRKFQREGTWEAIWAALYPLLRESEGREVSPTAGVIDSQTLQSAEKGDVTPRNQPPTDPTPWDMTQARR